MEHQIQAMINRVNMLESEQEKAEKNLKATKNRYNEVIISKERRKEKALLKEQVMF